MEYYLCLYRFW